MADQGPQRKRGKYKTWTLDPNISIPKTLKWWLCYRQSTTSTELTFWPSVISFLQNSCHFDQKLKKGWTLECTVQTVAKSEGANKKGGDRLFTFHFSLLSNQKARKSSRDFCHFQCTPRCNAFSHSTSTVH